MHHFGIGHISSLCLGFGLAHLTGFLGPGMWTSDSLNLVGSIRFVKASFNLLAYARLAYGVISSHHIISGLLGTSIGLWHITLRPLAYLYNLLSMGKVESILSSSITAVFFTAFLISALMWYGSAHTTQELFGPTRYSWDNAYYSLDIRTSCSNAWNTIILDLTLLKVAYFVQDQCTYSMEESQIQVYFSGGCLNGTEYSTPSLVKAYARKAQFGQIFTFDKKTSRLTDGVFRTSARGWYSFSHIALAFSFFFGHLWHASRAIFQDIWTGVNLNHKQNKNMVEMKS